MTTPALPGDKGLMDPSARRAFIREHAPPCSPPLCPGIRLHLASPGTPLWNAGARELAAWGLEAPFWAFCWAGGSALAAHILANPDTVRGHPVVDVGTGCGVVAIAAALAGASSVRAVDLDPWCVDAVALNADVNRVDITPSCADVATLAVEEAQVILAGDILYDADTGRSLWPWLRDAAVRAREVWVADGGRGILPEGALADVVGVDVPTDGAFERSNLVTVRVGRPADAGTRLRRDDRA